MSPKSTARISFIPVRNRLAPGLLWGLVLPLSYFASGGHSDPATALLVVSSASTLFGLWSFMAVGGSKITPAAVVCLGHAAMIGYSGAYNSIYPFRQNSDESLLTSAVTLYAALWVMVFVFWLKPVLAPTNLPLSASHALLPAGALLALVGTFGILRLGGGGEYESGLIYSFFEGAQAAGFVALVAWSASRYRSAVPSLALAGCLLFSALVAHSGGGRLRVAVLACAMASAISIFREHSSIKRWVVLGAPVMAISLARNRVDYIESQSGSSSSTGFESLVAPLNAFTSILSATRDGSLDLRMGRSFVTPAQQVFPNFMPGVEAFGYEIPAYTNPAVQSSNYSDAGYILGEFVYNFGALGILLGVLILGLALPKLSNLGMVFYAENGRAVWLVVWALAAGTCLEMAWGGVHVATLRFVTRGGVLLAVLLLLWFLSPKGQRA